MKGLNWGGGTQSPTTDCAYKASPLINSSNGTMVPLRH